MAASPPIVGSQLHPTQFGGSGRVGARVIRPIRRAGCLLGFAVLVPCGCGSAKSGLACGSGTRERSGICVVASGGAAGSLGGSGAPGGSGAAGTAGSGGFGGVPQLCVPTTLPSGSLFADFESGDSRVVGYPGGISWWVDATATGVTSAIDGPGHSSSYAAHLSIASYTDWGGEINLWLAGCYDLSRFTGVQFWAKEAKPSKILVLVNTEDSATVADGGICSASYCQRYTASVSVTTAWAMYQVLWSELTSSTAPPPMNAAKVNSVGFIDGHEVWGPVDSVDLWVDDVSFF